VIEPVSHENFTGSNPAAGEIEKTSKILGDCRNSGGLKAAEPTKAEEDERHFGTRSTVLPKFTADVAQLEQEFYTPSFGNTPRSVASTATPRLIDADERSTS
jgi:hypothetical protein